MNKTATLLILASATLLSACGGGGGGTTGGSLPPITSPTSTPPTNPTPVPTATPVGATPTPVPTATPTPVPTATPTPAPAGITGQIVSIPVGSFGTGAAQSPLANAVVIVGPTLILGATPPPTLPAGDVKATTDANGNYSVQVAAAQVAPDTASNAAFIKPVNDLSGTTPPTVGYYVSVFGAGSDGRSAGAPLPVHAFSAVAGGALRTLRVTTASSDEAGYLSALNAARIKANPAAAAMIFDETAQEAARQHSQDEATNNYVCHYDQSGIGPQSRLYRLIGLGPTGENVGFASGTPQQAYTAIIALWVSEAPSGAHYLNITDASHQWAGVSLAPIGSSQDLDEELVSPHASGAYTYGNFSGSTCPAGTPNNS